MSLFGDYVSRRRATQQTQQPAGSSDPGGYKAYPHGSLPMDYVSDGYGWDPETIRRNREKYIEKYQKAELPKIDTSDAIGSLAGMLGPTPEEREQQEQQLMEHKRKMHGWTALFNGIRQLSNLYFTTKGAAPQKYGDPHAEIEQQYQDERKRLADIQAQNQKYYAGLWGLYRQINDEQRRNMLAEAQRDYYGTRDEAARQKAERDRYSYQKMSNGSVIKIDRDEGTATEISEADPTYVKWRDSIITKNRQQGDAAMIRANKAGSGGRVGGRSNGVPYKEHYVEEETDPATGKKIKKYVAGRYGSVPTTGNQPSSEKQPKNKGAGGGGNRKRRHVGW